jgi:hypothetical protein
MRPLPSHLATPQLLKLARRLGAAPSRQSFGDFAAQLAPAVCFRKKLVRSAGIAPASPGWHPGILLLKDNRKGTAQADTVVRPRRLNDKRTNTAVSSIR